MNKSTLSDIVDALRLEFSVEVTGNKYSLQLKIRKKKAVLFLQTPLEMSAITFFHHSNNGGEINRGTKHIFYLLEQICNLSTEESYKTKAKPSKQTPI